MSYGNNVYRNPEAFGLTQISEADLGTGYNFDKYVLWRHEDGSFWFGHDSGCSCPSPFENFLGLHHLTRVFSAQEVSQIIISRYPKAGYARAIEFIQTAVNRGLSGG